MIKHHLPPSLSKVTRPSTLLVSRVTLALLDFFSQGDNINIDVQLWLVHCCSHRVHRTWLFSVVFQVQSFDCRSTELLKNKDTRGRTSLHVAATNGHHEMCLVLLGLVKWRCWWWWWRATRFTQVTKLVHHKKAPCPYWINILKSSTIFGWPIIWFCLSWFHLAMDGNNNDNNPR